MPCKQASTFISTVAAKESRHLCHQDTLKIAASSGKNDARDFWRFNEIDVAPWRR